jgi:hypothetical protein
MYKGNLTSGESPMQELKEQLKREARRHSSKLIARLGEVVDLPSIAKDSIHQEVLYSTMDGYRATMKHNRNGDGNEQETNGNY